MKRIVPDLGIVVAAGGSGRRFDPGCNKLLEDLNGMPVFMHSVAELHQLCSEANFVVSAPAGLSAEFGDICRNLIPDKHIRVVKGGRTRIESVYNGLVRLGESAKFAAVHDAARPFITEELLLSTLEEARRTGGGAALSRKIRDTVKRADSSRKVIETLDRESLYAVETPQIFPTEMLVDACKKALDENLQATDDAGVMQHCGHDVHLFVHNGVNLKITCREDLDLARMFCRAGESL